MKKRNFLTAGFIIVVIMVLVAQVSGNNTMNMVFKPMIMPLLAVMAVANGIFQKRSIAMFTLTALFFSWIGDILLMFQEAKPVFFVFGLGAFLLAHIFFIVVYKKATATSGKINGITNTIIRTLIISGYTLFLIAVVYDNLGEMKIPVILYAVVISVMVWSAFSRRGKTSAGSFSYVAAGSVIFVLSDSLIALNKFWQPLPEAGLIIMATYILAQYLIMRGLVKHVDSVKE